MSSAKFITWLRKQRDREDQIGDLARDYIDDCRFEKTQYSATELAFRVNLYGCCDAQVALTDAIAEYMRSVKGRS